MESDGGDGAGSEDISLGGGGDFERAEIDAVYFSSYEKVAVHKKMLKDKRRMRAYECAIRRHKRKIADKVVIDVGCGTGILSILCARMGAKHVYAVEASVMARKARKIVEANHLSEKITVVQGRVEDVELHLDKRADVMISEWMGQMLIFENMLESVIAARDRWLKPGGLMLPTFAELYMAPVSLPLHYKNAVGYWRNVCGVDMSAMIPLSRESAFARPVRHLIARSNVLTAPHIVMHINCKTVQAYQVQNIESEFNLKVKLINRPVAMMHGFAFWFKVVFESPRIPPVELLTGPSKGPTHWKQTILYLDRPVKVRKDRRIQGSIELTQNKKDHRALDISVEGGVGRSFFSKGASFDQITEGSDVFCV